MYLLNRNRALPENFSIKSVSDELNIRTSIVKSCFENLQSRDPPFLMNSRRGMFKVNSLLISNEIEEKDMLNKENVPLVTNSNNRHRKADTESESKVKVPSMRTKNKNKLQSKKDAKVVKAPRKIARLGNKSLAHHVKQYKYHHILLDGARLYARRKNKI